MTRHPPSVDLAWFDTEPFSAYSVPRSLERPPQSRRSWIHPPPLAALDRSSSRHDPIDAGTIEQIIIEVRPSGSSVVLSTQLPVRGGEGARFDLPDRPEPRPATIASRDLSSDPTAIMRCTEFPMAVVLADQYITRFGLLEPSLIEVFVDRMARA